MKNLSLVLLILILGILFRLPFILVSPYQVDYDNCTIGLMARHILQGKFPVFFYGQPYMGSIEAFNAAVFFLLFGQSGYSLMFSVLTFYVLFIISIYYLGFLIGGRKVGLYSILYLSFGPSYFLIHTYAPRGGYIETLFFGTLLLAISIMIADKISFGVTRRKLYMLLGFISGLAFWTHFLIVYYLLAIALFLGISEFRRTKVKTLIGNFLLSSFTFILGSLPLWIYNIKNGFPSLIFKRVVGEKIDSATMWRKLVFIDMWSLLGFEFVQIRWFNYTISAIYIFLFITFMYFLLKGTLSLFYPKIKGFRFGLLFLFLLITILIYTTNRFALLQSHKYLLPIFTLIPVGIGFVCSMLDNYKRYLGLFLITAIISFNITGSLRSLKKWWPEIKDEEREYKGLLEFCSKNNIDRIITPLWGPCNISFFSKERIITQRVRDEKLLEYAMAVERTASPSILSDPTISIPDSLDSIGCTYKEANFGRYSIWYGISAPDYYGRNILPTNWYAEANHGTDLVGFSFDRNMDFIWTTIVPKKNNMWFLLDMGRPYKIFKIVIYNGDHIHNYPNSYRLEISLDGKKWDVIQEVKDKEFIFASGPRVYWHDIDGRWEVMFNPKEARFIKLSLLDNSNIHPWEINEVFVYEYIDTRGVDYRTGLPELGNFLKKKNITFVYADFWLSAKLKEYDIRSLNPFLDKHPEVYTKRDIVLSRDTAFIVTTGEELGIEAILSSYNLSYNKEVISPYVVYYFDSLPNEFVGMPGLVWAGETLIKGNFKDRSWYLYKLGEQFIKDGELDRAIKCFKKSISCYKNNIMAYYRLAELGDTGMRQEYKLRTEPKVKGSARFGKDIEFLGFGIDKEIYSPGDTITIDYYWKIKKAIYGDLFVFVHFIKDKEIIFQNDHPFLEIYPRHLPPFSGEIFRERYKVVIPKESQKGDYLVRLGIWDRDTGERFNVVETEFPGGADYITIGKIRVS